VSGSFCSPTFFSPFHCQHKKRQNKEIRRLETNFRGRCGKLETLWSVLAAEDSSSLDTNISEKVNHLVESLLYVGDRDDVRYLQHHLKRVCPDEIRSALEPSATLQDFASRVSKAGRVKDVYEHDKELGTIVSQEIERGFIEDAVGRRQSDQLSDQREMPRGGAGFGHVYPPI
jgi:hypothetical protein